MASYHDDFEACTRAFSIEIAFDADAVQGGTRLYLAFLDQALALIQQERDNSDTAQMGYISLRYVTKSRGRLAMARFANNVFIEMATIKDLPGQRDLIRSMANLAVNRGGILHWGQQVDPGTYGAVNVEQIYGQDLVVWRSIRRGLVAGSTVFANDYSSRLGLDG